LIQIQCRTRHSVAYNNLPDFFIAFDIYDKSSKRWLPNNEIVQLLDDTGISIVPLLTTLSTDGAKCFIETTTTTTTTTHDDDDDNDQHSSNTTQNKKSLKQIESIVEQLSSQSSAFGEENRNLQTRTTTNDDNNDNDDKLNESNCQREGVCKFSLIL
jgi:hypothetical protein